MAQATVRIQLSVPPEEYEAAAAAAMRSGETLTGMIRRLLREAASQGRE